MAWGHVVELTHARGENNVAIGFGEVPGAADMKTVNLQDVICGHQLRFFRPAPSLWTLFDLKMRLTSEFIRAWIAVVKLVFSATTPAVAPKRNARPQKTAAAQNNELRPGIIAEPLSKPPPRVQLAIPTDACDTAACSFVGSSPSGELAMPQPSTAQFSLQLQPTP